MADAPQHFHLRVHALHGSFSAEANPLLRAVPFSLLLELLMHHTFRPLLGLAATLTLVAGTAQAQSQPQGRPNAARASAAAQAGRSEDRPNAARGSASATDENIRVAAGTNSRTGAAVAAPSQKAPAGTATRGNSSCAVHFDNRSTLYISTYADGTFRGSLSPWGDVYTYVIAGPTRLYARAAFDDGSVSTWGPRMVDCPAGGSYQWMLYY